MASSSPSLTALQRDILAAFFEREGSFFLTEGAALAGYHLHHRQTADLDLFTVDDDAFGRARHVLVEVARSLGTRMETRQAAPGFERHLLTREDGAVVVDLVLEQTPQVVEDKPDRDGVRVDPPEEILANKLTTLLSRSEERDLVDLMYLEQAGYHAESALDHALAKDGGCTPAQLAFLLSEIEIPDAARLPADVAPAELRAFVDDLIVRLRRAALPASDVEAAVGNARERGSLSEDEALDVAADETRATRRR